MLVDFNPFKIFCLPGPPWHSFFLSLYVVVVMVFVFPTTNKQIQDGCTNYNSSLFSKARQRITTRARALYKDWEPVFHNSCFLRLREEKEKEKNTKTGYTGYSPAGRSVLGKTVPDVLDTARGRRPRAVSKTEGTVFPNTDRPSAGE